MATKKDLVEAYSFSRRRLVTAFVSGAPGGREVEPTRPGRAVIGGIALAVLLVAGGAVLGILKSPSTVMWDQEQMVIEKETGAAYLLLAKTDGSGGTDGSDGSDGSDESDLELRPLINITSAMLIFGPQLDPQDVPHDEISKRGVGAPIGILDAPPTPPDVDKLVQTGWTACTNADGSGGLRSQIADDPGVTTTSTSSFAVRTTSGKVYVISESGAGFSRGERAYTYEVPAAADLGVLLPLTGTVEPTEVPDRFVGLFPAGGDLSMATFGIGDGDYRTRWSQASAATGTEKAKVGDLLAAPDGTYLVVPDGAVFLDDFSSALYRNLSRPKGKQPRTITVPQNPVENVRTAADLPDANWPTTVHNAEQPGDQLCALLDVEADRPGVHLATTTDDSPAAAADLEGDDEDVTVEPGHGAFVFSGDWVEGGETEPTLVDPRGSAYRVGPGEEQAQLGYSGVDEVVVPNVWLKLLDEGVPLTIDAARCPPTSVVDPAPEGGGCS